MSKRSRDSLSPLRDLSPSNSGARSPRSEEEDTRLSKISAVESSTVGQAAMKCSLPPHQSTLEFPSIEAFEVHYAKDHTNRCSSCGKNLPSAHFLALHMDENHNPLREEMAARGEKTFACFLPECGRKCSNTQKRRQHMIDKHHFPKFYNFRVIDQGIDNTTSLLPDGRRRRVSNAAVPSREHPRRALDTRSVHPADDIRLNNSVTNRRSFNGGVAEQDLVSTSTDGLVKQRRTSDDDDIDGLETSLSALSFVPRSVMSRHSRKGGH